MAGIGSILVGLAAERFEAPDQPMMTLHCQGGEPRTGRAPPGDAGGTPARVAAAASVP
jgi:hypothetical protein